MKLMKEIAEAAAGAVVLPALFAAFWVVTDYVHDRTEHAHGEPACAWEWCPHGPNSPTARIAAWWKGGARMSGWTRRNTPTTVNPAHVVSIDVFERGTNNGGDVWDIVLSNGLHYKVGDADAMNAADEIEGVE